MPAASSSNSTPSAAVGQGAKVDKASEIRRGRFTFPQPAFDRLHAWLMSMTIIVAELSNDEEDECDKTWFEATKNFEAFRKWSQLPPAERKPHRWSGLLARLGLLMDAFSKVDNIDRLQVVQQFHVERYVPSPVRDDMESSIHECIFIQTVNRSRTPLEIIKFKFSNTEAFLHEAFLIVLAEVEEKGLMGQAVTEAKLVTVPEITQEWIPRMGIKGRLVSDQSASERSQSSICNLCLQYANVPFFKCNFCGDSPSFHHGRCCPEKPKEGHPGPYNNEANILEWR
jgi:hypothetical protein